MNYLQRLYSGRMSRRAWAVGISVLCCLYGIIYLILGNLLDRDSIGLTSYFVILLPLAAITAILIFGLHVRRFHDKGESGRTALFLLIPLINIIVFIDLLRTPGQNIRNAYGEVPPRYLFPHHQVLNKIAEIVAILFGGLIALSTSATLLILLLGSAEMQLLVPIQIVTLWVFYSFIRSGGWPKKEVVKEYE